MTLQEKIQLLERLLKLNPDAQVKHFMMRVEMIESDERLEKLRIYDQYARGSRTLNGKSGTVQGSTTELFPQPGRPVEKNVAHKKPRGRKATGPGARVLKKKGA
jgi:hypothetical protein